MDRTVTTTIAGLINHLHTMLHGEALRGFYELDSQNNRTIYAHLKEREKAYNASHNEETSRASKETFYRTTDGAEQLPPSLTWFV